MINSRGKNLRSYPKAIGVLIGILRTFLAIPADEALNARVVFLLFASVVVIVVISILLVI